MADLSKLIYQGQPGTSDTLLYTAPANPVIVRGIHIVNVSLAAVTVRLAFNAGGALAAAQAWLWDYSIAVGGTYDWSGFEIVSASGTIRALQSSATGCSFMISGIEQ